MVVSVSRSPGAASALSSVIPSTVVNQVGSAALGAAVKSIGATGRFAVGQVVSMPPSTGKVMPVM